MTLYLTVSASTAGLIGLSPDRSNAVLLCRGSLHLLSVMLILLL